MYLEPFPTCCQDKLSYCHFSLIINEDCVNLKNNVQNQIGRHQISLHDNFYSYMTSPYMLLKMLTYCHLSLIINEDCVNFKNKVQNQIHHHPISVQDNFYSCATSPYMLLTQLTFLVNN